MTKYTFEYSYADLERLTGMTKSAISQNVGRNKLIPNDLASVCAFLARHGTAEIRRQIVDEMLGLDRQSIERSRPQATKGVGRTAAGKVKKATKPPRQAKSAKQDSSPKTATNPE